MQNERYYGLDEVGLRCWQLLAEDGSLANAIAQEKLNEFGITNPSYNGDRQKRGREHLNK